MRRPILCAIDQSPEALAAGRLARTLARHLDAPLILVHAIPLLYPAEGWTLLGGVPPIDHRDPQEHARRHGEALLRRVVSQLQLSEGTETLLLVGDVDKELVRAAASTEAAAVVVGARGRGRVKRAVLGSVSGHLAASAPCPVVIVPHGARSGALLAEGPLLCGVDGSEHAEHAAMVAAAAARRLGRELILVHVLPAALERDGVAHRDGWATLVAAVSCIDAEARLMVEPGAASVAATLSEIAQREGAACLIVGSRGRGPVRSALLGSVSAGATVQSKCAVVVVPPESRAFVEHGLPAFATDMDSA